MEIERYRQGDVWFYSWKLKSRNGQTIIYRDELSDRTSAYANLRRVIQLLKVAPVVDHTLQTFPTVLKPADPDAAL